MASESNTVTDNYANRTLEAITEAVKNYANDVRLVFPVEKALLFGSWVKGNASAYSDVDVCFFLNNCGNKSNREVLFKIFELSYKYYEMLIEPHVFKKEGLKSDHPFIREILETGIEI